MVIYLRFFHIIFFFVALSLSFISPKQGLADMNSKAPVYELSITFQPEKNQLSGTAHIFLGPGEDLIVNIEGLNVSSIMVNRPNAEVLVAQVPDSPRLHLMSSPKAQDIFISYTKILGRSYDNIISPTGITLTSDWHPIPDKNVLFKLKCTVPKGFTAISESDQIRPETKTDQFEFSLNKPLQTIHFAAAPYQVKQLKVRDGLSVYTLFFKEDNHLADDYLKKAAGYLRRYETEIGPYPYNHYAIVENRLPVGYGMNTFTLLGQMVIRLPFIKDTSLGHEILHSWFGNSIEADYNTGNWGEGLTTYLADQAFLREKGEGPTSRKNTLVN